MNGFHHPTSKRDIRAVDDGRPLRVFIIGAGICGVALYIRLLQYVPNVKITIVDKNPELGGTWYENRYPGVACDIPSHVYQYTFESNPRWSKLFSPGSEILSYVKDVAHKYRVDDKIKYNTKVVGAEWNEDDGIWSINTESTGPDSGLKTKVWEAEVLISAAGVLNDWKWPDIQGLETFQGKLLHSANWDETWDYTGKTVALLGSGSSAIQILPQLQKKCPRVHSFIRGGTWISQALGGQSIEDMMAKDNDPGNYSYTKEELERFEQDPEHYHAFRKQMETYINGGFPFLLSGTAEQQDMTQSIQENMREKLSSKPGLYETLAPDFTPGCRRLTPGPGYLEALVCDNVDLIKTPIVHVTEKGVVTQDGKEWPVDAIVCATGFDCSFMPRFPIIGREGKSLRSRWSKRASAYMSHSIPGFPNYFTVGGPNSVTGGGSLLLIFESIIGYVVKAVQKMSREHIKTMEVKEDALSSWTASMDEYFPGTVHVESCSSWYKIRDKIVALWPGSSLHAMKTLEHPRWEDYNYERDEGADELKWIGNGWTMDDVRKGEMGYYLDDVDVPPIPSDELLSTQP